MYCVRSLLGLQNKNEESSPCAAEAYRWLAFSTGRDDDDTGQADEVTVLEKMQNVCPGELEQPFLIWEASQGGSLVLEPQFTHRDQQNKTKLI